MHWATGNLAAIFDGGKGEFFGVVLIGLIIAGAIVLIVNLSARPRPAAPPKWEHVPDDAPTTAPPPRQAPATPPKPAAPRRKA